MINGKHGQGTNSTKMGADKSAENTPNAPKFLGPICLPNPKSLRFWIKRSLWVSVVRGCQPLLRQVLIPNEPGKQVKQQITFFNFSYNENTKELYFSKLQCKKFIFVTKNSPPV